MQQIVGKLGRALHHEAKIKKNNWFGRPFARLVQFITYFSSPEIHRKCIDPTYISAYEIQCVLTRFLFFYKNRHRKSISIRKENRNFSIKTFFFSTIGHWAAFQSDTDRISLREASQWGSKQQAHACSAQTWFMVTDVDMHCDKTEPHWLRATK